MSKSEHKRAIEWELKRLNTVIDQKIVKGLSYRTEARRHLSLLKELKRCNNSWNFSKALSFFSFL
jgi:hypothetical protein